MNGESDPLPWILALTFIVLGWLWAHAWTVSLADGDKKTVKLVVPAGGGEH